MAITMAPTSGTGPGNASSRGFYAVSGKALIAYPFVVTFDTSYTTAGQSIAATVANSPYAVLGVVESIDVHPGVAPGGTGGATAGQMTSGAVDLVNKKILLSVAFAEATNATNYSLIKLRCIAYGHQ